MTEEKLLEPSFAAAIAAIEAANDITPVQRTPLGVRASPHR